MTVISNIDEHGINTNLRVRYVQDSIYVSVKSFFIQEIVIRRSILELELRPDIRYAFGQILDRRISKSSSAIKIGMPSIFQRC